ncbi:MAG: sensor histidine kinase [Rhizobiaceae bacterium]|nr:sensor histidine kinase [Rhizobiaceae bacterium]
MRAFHPFGFVLLLLLGVCLATAARAQVTLEPLPEPFLPFAEAYPFIADDDLAYADPGLDDSAWSKMKPDAVWGEAGVPLMAREGWFRIHFQLPQAFDQVQPALTGFLMQPDQIFLNGVEISNRGQLREPGDFFHVRPPWSDFAAHALPRDLLNESGDNVVAIRFIRYPFDDIRAIHPVNFGIADHANALLAKRTAERFYWLIDGLLLGMSGLIASFAIAALVVGQRDRLFVKFAGFAVLVFVSHLKLTHALAASGANPVLLFQLGNLLDMLTLAVTLEFAATFLAVKVGRFGRLLQLLCLGSLLEVLPFWSNDGFAASIASLQYFAIIAIPVWVSVAAFRAIMRGRQDAWYFALIFTATTTLPITASIVWVGLPERWVLFQGHEVHTIPLLLFLLYLTVVMGIRTYRIERARLVANERALNAHLVERSRIARDIHDTLTQWLGAFKLKLQLVDRGMPMGATADRGSIQGVLGEMDALINQSRRIAHDISPTLVRERGLQNAVQELTEAYRHSTTMSFHLEVDTDLLSAEVQEHLYRTIQEAVANATRHGKASHIDISLSMDRRALTLAIEDDGQGFDPTGSGKLTLGLNNIRERAELLDGAAEIASTAGKGTTIRITIPDVTRVFPAIGT